jgi:nitrate reductase delta subunit
MSDFSILAEAFRYPAPGRLGRLRQLAEQMQNSSAHRLLDKFIVLVQSLSLGEWEELYTSALDLNPSAAPYLGFQTWGESYQRGEFMARLNHELARLSVDTDGELPDHIIPALRYLDATVEPLPELLAIFEPAVRRAAAALRKSDADNPYNLLFEAALCAVQSLAATAPENIL